MKPRTLVRGGVISDASKKLIEIIDTKKENENLFFETTGGGCNGFNYNLELSDRNVDKFDVSPRSNSQIMKKIFNRLTKFIINFRWLK